MFGAVSLQNSSVSLFVCTGILAAMHPRAVNGQDADGQESEKLRHSFFNLRELDLFLELESDYRYNKVKTEPRRRDFRKLTQTNREWDFEERVGLRLDGFLLDPGFISFGGELSFALTQDHYEEFGTFLPDRRDTDNGYLLQYDLRMNIFPGKLLSGSVYGVRQDDRVARRFQPTLDQRRTGFGTNWTFTHDTFPMELSFDFLETDRWGNRDGRDDETFQESRFFYSVSWLMTDHHRLKFSYEHSETEQEYQGSPRQFETTRDLFTLDHELEFGDKHQHEFRTLVHWQEEAGDFARDFFEIGPQLSLRHNDNLQTFYKYQFNRERYAGLDIETHRADFQLVHQIYSNLTTTLNAFALYEDIEDDINTTQYGASVDWQYNRRNPYGHLYTNLALAYDTEHVRGDDGRRVVLDESHTFQDPYDARLRNENVVHFTILVTDASNRRYYELGRDYTVYRFGDVTRIARIPTGRIADGDTVLIDYQYDTPQDGQIDTMRVDFNVEQRFTSGWTPYYRFSYRNQEGDFSRGFTRRADRTDHHRLGVRFEHKRFTLGAELEVFDDTIDPYHGFHVNGLLHIIQAPDHTFDASARFSRLDFEGGFSDRNVSLFDVALDHRWRVNESLSTFERLMYRLEEDSVSGSTHGWDVTVGLRYAVGDLTSELTVEYDRLDLPGSEDEDFGVFFRVRRDFNNVLARR